LVIDIAVRPTTHEGGGGGAADLSDDRRVDVWT
jgi:hypothetical protein